MKTRLTDWQVSLVAFWWGMCESLFLFVVPDVFVTYQMIHSRRRGIFAFVASLAGSLLAGLLIYLLVAVFGLSLQSFLLWQPGVTAGMFPAVAEKMTAGTSILGLASSGIPYRVYAEVLLQSGKGLVWFAGFSLALRLVRLGLPAIGAWLTVTVFRKNVQAQPRLWYGIHIVGWMLFYSFWFWFITSTY